VRKEGGWEEAEDVLLGGSEGETYSGTAVAQFLGVTTSSVNRVADSEELRG
jgi:hypothetical protein